MHVLRRLSVFTIMVLGTGHARADFISEFDGFATIDGIGVSGLTSSYYGDTTAGLSLTGPTTSTSLALFGSDRISYPSNIGEVPSPGGLLGTHFDQGMLGWKLDGSQLTFKLAGGLDPLSGYYHSGWKTWYGQGDLFVSVKDNLGLHHFALLSNWATDDGGNPHQLNRGFFSDAQAFHLSGGAGGENIEGHLVELAMDSDVLISGGRGAYTSSNAPFGLDRRVYAGGGTDLGDAALVHGSFSDLGQQWYTQTWTLNLADLSTDADFEIGLHAAPSCGNDQIGATFAIPEPATLALLTFGLAAVGLRRR